MNRLFNLDNPVWNFLSKCVDLIILSLLWLLFSLPVITLGASTAALYHSVHKSISTDSGYAAASFWKSFRDNLRQGTALTLLLLLPAAFCVVSRLFARSLGDGSPLGLIYRTAAILVGILTFSTAFYLFALLSRFYMRTADLAKTAFALAVTRAGFTLILDIVLGVCILGIYLIPASVLVLPALGAWAAERLIEPALRKLQETAQEREPEAPAAAMPDEEESASGQPDLRKR